MELLTAPQILDRLRQRPFQRFPALLLGGDVLIAKLSGAELDELDTHYAEAKAADPVNWRRGFRARLVALCLVDDKGQRLFTEADVDDLSQGAGDAVDEIFDECRRYNRVFLADTEKKSSPTTPAGSSSSSSPGSGA